MIEFTDFTLREGNGDYQEVARLMSEDTFGQDWMLRSEAFISTPFIASKFVLHLWKNGNVVIQNTDRPLRIDIADDDLRELSQWCEVNGWKELQVDKRLLDDRVGFECWHRAFIAGIIKSDTLQKKEDEEMERLMKAQRIEEETDAS
jgi:hypothetical protein